jgi:preprotein translocase subunit SecG
MDLIAAVDWRHYMFMIPLIILSIFLMLVILVQRGRGGGLTGALGGMGGQSAFGTKAGDLFTRITIIVAAIWVLLSLASVKFLNLEGSRGGLNASERGITLPAPTTDTKAPADKTGETAAPAGDTDTTALPTESSSTTPAAPAEKSAAPATPAPAETPASSTDNAKP